MQAVMKLRASAQLSVAMANLSLAAGGSHTSVSTASPERFPTLIFPLWLLQLPPGRILQALASVITTQSKGSTIAGHCVECLLGGHVKHNKQAVPMGSTYYYFRASQQSRLTVSSPMSCEDLSTGRHPADM